MKLKTPKYMTGKKWAYFAPDGYLQVRSIAETKEDSRLYLLHPYSDKTFIDYEKAGYTLHRIQVDIKALD